MIVLEDIFSKEFDNSSFRNTTLLIGEGIYQGILFCPLTKENEADFNFNIKASALIEDDIIIPNPGS